MTYRVIITPPAKHRLEMYIAYTLNEFKSVQAARSIRDDAKLTKLRLSNIAGSLALCNNPLLAKYGYRKISFCKHAFFMVYRIDGKNVIVDGIYHELQDYESIFVHEMHLD